MQFATPFYPQFCGKQLTVQLCIERYAANDDIQGCGRCLVANWKSYVLAADLEITLRLFNIAMENCPFIDGLPITK